MSYFAEGEDFDLASTEEDDVVGASRELGYIEKLFAEEIVRLISSGTQSYLAQRMAEVEYTEDLATARALYEIALNRMRRA